MDFAEEYVERYSFLVPQLTIEQPLYRYRSYMKYIIDEIKNDHIYLSDIEQLNDPFDSSFATQMRHNDTGFTAKTYVHQSKSRAKDVLNNFKL